jgi:hypothetical protein
LSHRGMEHGGRNGDGNGLAAVNGACYFSAHEHALRNPSRRGQLPHPEQEILLEHLARKLGARPDSTEFRDLCG